MLLPIASPITVTRALIESGTIRRVGKRTISAYALASSSRSLATTPCVDRPGDREPLGDENGLLHGVGGLGETRWWRQTSLELRPAGRRERRERRAREGTGANGHRRRRPDGCRLGHVVAQSFIAVLIWIVAVTS